MRPICLEVFLLFALCLILEVSAKKGGEKVGQQQQCGRRLAACAQPFKQYSNSDAFIAAMQQRGITWACGNVQQALDCLTRMVADKKCRSSISPEMRKFVLNAKQAADFACVERKHEFQENWECLFDSSVRDEMEACEDMESNLKNCDVEAYVRCAEATLQSSSACNDSALQLVRDFSRKIIRLIPNCADQSQFRQMWLNMFK